MEGKFQMQFSWCHGGISVKELLFPENHNRKGIQNVRDYNEKCL